jgi:serine/threonine-protein kinase
MVHRDIKPANIMLDVHGQGILMDFGIVKILGGDSHTSTGAVVGTARYMSPEIIRGEVADNRSDIYSLGVTLYEMLSGRPPFVADSAMTLMMMHLNDPIPNVREFRDDVPPELVDVLEKSMAKDRADRYQTAAAMAADLRRALASIGGLTTSVRPKETKQSESPATMLDSQPVKAIPPVPATMVDSQPAYQAVSPPPATAMESQPGAKAVDHTPSEPGPAAGAASQPMPRPAPTPKAATPLNLPPRVLWIGAGALALLCFFGLFAINRFILNPGAAGAPDTPTPTLAEASPTSEATSAEVVAPVATDTLAPTETPTETPPPTETLPPLYARINSITVDGSGNYVVDFETFGYTPVLPGMHVHFFFDTVPVEQAGSPGSGPWYLYGGPSPFTRYREADRPADATQMCALVANANHSIIPESGNCFNLP